MDINPWESLQLSVKHFFQQKLSFGHNALFKQKFQDDLDKTQTRLCPPKAHIFSYTMNFENSNQICINLNTKYRQIKDYCVLSCFSHIQLCATLWTMGYTPSGSSVHGILQARILEQIAVPFSRESSQEHPAIVQLWDKTRRQQKQARQEPSFFRKYPHLPLIMC